MRQRKKPLHFLFISIAALLGFGSLIFFFPPTHSFVIIGQSLSIFYLFFLMLFVFLFSLGTYFFKSKTQGLLIGLFIISLLVFRLNNLNHPFFFILLAALFLTLELLFTYKK